MEPPVLRPGVVAILARMRNGVKAPAQSTAVHIEGADVARRRRMRLRIPPAYDDQVLVDDSWCGECDRLLTIIPAKIFAEVDTPILPEAPDRSAIARIECVEEVGDPGEKSALRIVRPPCEAAYRLRALHAGIEAPEQL